MSTSCHILYDLLPLYVDGACSDESRAYVEEHLAGCPACRKKYEAMAGTVDVLLGKPEYAGKNEEAKVRQQINRTSKKVPGASYSSTKSFRCPKKRTSRMR